VDRSLGIILTTVPVILAALGLDEGRAQDPPSAPVAGSVIPLQMIPGASDSPPPVPDPSAPQPGTPRTLPTMPPGGFSGLGGNEAIRRLQNPFDRIGPSEQSRVIRPSEQTGAPSSGGPQYGGMGAAGSAAGGTPGGAAPPGAGAEGAAGAGGAPGAYGTGEFAADSGGAGPGFGGGLGASGDVFPMIGDRSPLGTRATLAFPPVPPTPGIPNEPRPPRPFSGLVESKAKTVVPYIRSYKMADNQSPFPQDRIFSSFNYYNDVNAATNRRFGSPVSGIQIYRYLLGFEKTFLDGYASIGVLDTINNLSSDSRTPGLGGTSTAMGDLNIFVKGILWNNLQQNPSVAPDATSVRPYQSQGGLLSGGLCIGMPTGPGSFAGAPFSVAFRNTALQPFLAYYWGRGRFFMQGFEAISVPLDRRDVVMLYNDTAIGYYVYRSKDPHSWVTSIAPTFEVNVNVPLTHRDVFDITDPVGTADVVDLTYGISTLFGRRSLLTLGLITPVTGPRPFNLEAAAYMTYFFGGPRRSPRNTSPPLIGL
jgi:hypothetical protein